MAYVGNFLDQMALGKANAKRERDRAGSTVRVYATAEARERALGPRHELDRLEDFYKQWRHETRMDCYCAVEFALFGHEWEDFRL